MSANIGKIVDKYQDVASQRIINAVQKAAKRTGVDFGFLMEKASTESNFNPAAKSKHSSATGLFQFIENTWLNMVKEHGAKYGLQEYADKITINDSGKAGVADGRLKKEILDLRKNPEISALMAGEYCSSNQEYLEDNTKCDVGATELYLAHFMGAGGAAKFLNSRDTNPEVRADALFPKAARANKTVFYDRATGRARSLDEVYNIFAKKFNDGTVPPSSGSKSASPSLDAAAYGSGTAPVTAPPIDPLDVAAQALPSFDDANTQDDIIWNDDPRFFGRIKTVKNPNGYSKLSPANMLAVMEAQEGGNPNRPRSSWYNS